MNAAPLTEERIAECFHDTYERLAPTFGVGRSWSREASAKPWEQIPVENRRLVVAVVERLIDNGVILPGPAGEVRDPL